MFTEQEKVRIDTQHQIEGLVAGLREFAREKDLRAMDQKVQEEFRTMRAALDRARQSLVRGMEGEKDKARPQDVVEAAEGGNRAFVSH